MVEWFPVSSIPKGKLNKKDTHLRTLMCPTPGQTLHARTCTN
jgi:hypothetical protein